MSKKKQSAAEHAPKFARIFQWVEQQDPEFAGAIRDLCLEGALAPSARHPAVTFLYPADAAYRAEIVALAYSDSTDDAVKMVEALVLPDAFLTAADFGRRPVGSRAGVRYAAEVAGRGVKIAPDVALAVAEDFAPLAKREGNVAVWRVTAGRLPLTGDAYAAPAPAKKAEARGGPGEGAEERRRLAAETEGLYAAALRAGRGTRGNPFLARAVSLLNWLRARAPEAYAAVQPLVDLDAAITFYLLLEPYKTADASYLLPGAVLFGDGGWNGAEAFSDAVKEYEDHLRAFAAADCALARDRPGVVAAVDTLRQQITADSNPNNAPAQVAAAYAALASHNRVGGLDGVLPAATLRLLPGAKKLWQDELRFVLHAALADARSPEEFAAVVQDLRTRWPGNDYAAELTLAHREDVKRNPAPRDVLMMLIKFINSTDFLYTPPSPDAVGGAWGSMDPTDPGVYNRNAEAAAGLRKASAALTRGGISPGALAELQVYMQMHGKLPEEVTTMK